MGAGKAVIEVVSSAEADGSLRLAPRFIRPFGSSAVLCFEPLNPFCAEERLYPTLSRRPEPERALRFSANDACCGSFRNKSSFTINKLSKQPIHCGSVA